MSGVEDLKVLTGEPVSGENQNFSHDKSDILNDEEHIETDKVPDGTLDDPDIRDSNLTNEIINLETTAVKSRMQVSIDKCDWTLVEKEDIPKDFDEGFSRSVTQEETDSESIETISDDEPFVKSFNNPLQHKQDVYNSLNSQTSTISDGIPIKNSLDGGVDEQYLWNRDGEQELQESEASVSDMLDEIPAEKEEEIEKAENVDEVRIENNEQDENVEDNVAQQEEEVKVEDGDDYENEDGEENDEYDDRHNADDENNVIEPVEELERGEPGIDEDDDGFRGNFLVRLLGDLYPSQELDPGFSRIRRGEVYKHNKNFQLNSLLTAILVLMAALVIGLGIGHFLGMSEKLEVVEMYDQIQEEKLCHLQDELVTCISGVEGQGGDDQDLDDRVIRALWEENQELRDQVHHLKSNIGDTREEAMTAILRDRINNLLTANGDLEREVARLRYAEAARGAAESIESLEQLRQTRDVLNNIVDENDQLKIQVGKYRYGAAPNSAAPNTRAPNSAAPITDEDTVIDYDESGKAIDDSNDADVDIEVDSPEIDENNEMSISSKVQKEDLSKSWPMRRQHDIKREEERRRIDKDGEDENDNDDGYSETAQKTNEYDNTDEGYVSDKKEMKNNEESWEKKSTNQNKPNDDRKIIENDEHKHPVLKEISRKIAKKLSKFGSKLFDAAGEINWEDTKHFFSGLQEDIGVKLSSLGGLNLNIFQEKFAEIRGFVEKGELEGHVESTKTAARKLLKSLMHSVKDLQEAAKDATEKSSWNNQLNEEISKIKMKMERSWTDIKNTWTNIINQKMDKDQQKDSPDSKYKRSQDEKRVKKIKEKEKKNNRRQEEKEYGRKFAEERRETENIKIDETKRQEHKKDIREKENKWSRKEYKRERGNEKMKKEEEEDEDWTSRRGMGRSLKRNQESKGDWVFERARQRKNVRLEEEKEDWYEARKRRRSRGEDCEDDCESERGECEGEKCYAIKR